MVLGILPTGTFHPGIFPKGMFRGICMKSNIIRPKVNYTRIELNFNSMVFSVMKLNTILLKLNSILV